MDTREKFVKAYKMQLDHGGSIEISESRRPGEVTLITATNQFVDASRQYTLTKDEFEALCNLRYLVNFVEAEEDLEEDKTQEC